MKNKNTIEFESFLENEGFIRLLKEDPLLANELIEDFCREMPDQESDIRQAAQLIRHYQQMQVKVSQDTVARMWKSILDKSDAKKADRQYRIAPFLQIAASVAVLVVFSIYFYEYYQENLIRKFAAQPVEISKEARIVISDGSAYNLESNGANVSYDADGREIVIEAKNNKPQKLNNGKGEDKSAFNQFIVPYGRRHSLTLSDGTIVQLNSGSKLVFPARFTGNYREVYLKGEGLFSVTKQAGKPFIVKTDHINIKVLGTRFNVAAYENDKSASAVLVEGSVEVSGNELFLKSRCKIVPGQGCFLAANSSEFQVKAVDVNEYTSWVNGILNFRDMTFKAVIEKVERFYNIHISVEDAELAKRLISGKLVLSEKVDETLGFLTKATRSRCDEKDGTYFFVK